MRRFLSILLLFCMTLSLLPTHALAVLSPGESVSFGEFKLDTFIAGGTSTERVKVFATKNKKGEYTLWIGKSDGNAQLENNLTPYPEVVKGSVVAESQQQARSYLSHAANKLYMQEYPGDTKYEKASEFASKCFIRLPESNANHKDLRIPFTEYFNKNLQQNATLVKNKQNITTSYVSTLAATSPGSAQTDTDTISWLLFMKNAGVNKGVFEDSASEIESLANLVNLTETVAANALDMAKKSLGDYKDQKTFKDQAIWCAKDYIIRVQEAKKTGGTATPPDPITQSDVKANTTLSDLERASILSLYHILDTYQYEQMGKDFPYTYGMDNADFTDKIDGKAGSNVAIDSAPASYALKQYLASYDAGINDDLSSMLAFPQKLKAILGLASGAIGVSADVNASDNEDEIKTATLTSGEIQKFIDSAFTGNTMDAVREYMYANVSGIDTNHIGAKVNVKYVYYVMLAYNEFASYGAPLINTLAPAIVDGNSTFSSYSREVAALQAMYEVVTWANDDNLWEYWTADNPQTMVSDTKYNSLKEVYDYLLSVGAFNLLNDYDPSKVDGSAFKYFFGNAAGKNTQAWQLSSDMQEGIVASASFIPMRTNLYDPYTYSSLVPTSWLVNFHSKFGYNRKALYIDTNVDSAVNWHRTGTRGELRVCTLKDLLYADKDIILYLDDNLYNVNKLAELTGKAFDRLDNSDAAGEDDSTWDKISGAITGFWDVSMESVAKTAEVTTYSQKVRNSVSQSDNLFGSHKWTDYLYDMDTATKYLSPDDVWNEETESTYAMGEEGHEASTYTPLTAFATISGVYLEGEVFTGLNTTLSKNTPVFVSSPTLPFLEEASIIERKSIYNYLLLKNLESQMTIDYATNLDMTSPVYMDIYGNIATESGVVVVPAAANATLWTENYSPYNAAFFSTYGDDFLLDYDESNAEFNDIFKNILLPKDGKWHLASVRVNGGNVDLSKLSTADIESLSAIAEVFKGDLSRPSGIYTASLWRMIITEVLRGAPIEYIDKEFEGLNISHRVTKNGLVVAEKLEFLVDALSAKGVNTTLSIPNPAFMDGIEYVVFFAFKLLILAVLVIWMVVIYLDAVVGSISLRTGGKCILVVVLVLSLIVGVPAAFEVSYYQSNKLLLQDEAELLMMLNLEKYESGQEIGITDIHEPETNTSLYLKLADVDIPWYDLLPKILISSSYNNLEELYEEYEGQHPISGAENITIINDGIYISTQQLFDSSTVTFSPTIKTLYQQATADTPASYYTPYYYFLEQLIDDVNTYSSDNDHYAYTTKIQRGGKLKTLGYIQPYFTSSQFMEEGMDYFGLYNVYDVTPPVEIPGELVYNEEMLDILRTSQWCSMKMSEDSRISRIEKLNQFTREWVAEHKDMIGKVTDETFLKSMALACAMEHNRLFNTMRADALEIYELSNEDLLRLSIDDKNSVMSNSTMSYARFVFTTGGTPAVYAAALLTLVNFVSSWVKPIATILVFLITCISIFVFKMILRRENNSIYGYICTILLMCSVNVIGSVFLKLSMFLPNTGLPPTVCILIQIVVQCLYMFLLIGIVILALRDWSNVGFQHYSAGFNKLIHNRHYSVEVDTPNRKSGWDYYNALVERQRRRHRRL